MKKPPAPMHRDPNEPEFIRDLLQNAIDTPVHYDVQQGLARHQAHIAAGTPPPAWAGDVLSNTANTAAGSAAGAATGSVVTSWLLASAAAVAVIGVGVMVAVPDAATPRSATKSVQHTGEAAPSAPTADERQPAPVAEAAAPVSEVDNLDSADQGAAAAAKETTKRAPARRKPSRRAARKRAAPSASGKTANQASSQTAKQAERADVQAPGATTAPAGSKPAGSKPAGSERAAGTSPAVEVASPVDAVVDEAREPVARAERDAPAAGQAQAEATQQAAQATREPVAEDPHERWSRGAMADDDGPDKAELLAREMRMLKLAQAVLKENPGRALNLARQGEREFPGSTFTQERQHLLILALVELDRVDEAKRLAARYLKKYPRGPFSDRVRKALASQR